MVVASVVFTLRLHVSKSLKEKRMVVSSVKKRLSTRFNVAIAEVGSLDSWRNAELAIATVSSSRVVAEQEVEAVTRFLDGDIRFEVVDREVEIS